MTKKYNRKKLLDAVEAQLPSRFGKFRIAAFLTSDGQNHAALVLGKPTKDALVRIHSECLTGDVFHSLRCDCRGQLEKAIAMIVKEGKGIIVYLRQEGRGIGLYNKIKAYKLQEQGMDTVEANEKLGFKADQRDFRIAAEIIRYLGVESIRLMTNNPLKVFEMAKAGIFVSQRIPVQIKSSRYNRSYLQAKKIKLGHFFP